MYRHARRLALGILAVLALAAPAAAQTSADDLATRTADTFYRLAHLFEPPQQSITIPNTFVNGTVADATQVNANFTALSSNAVNRNGGTMLGTLNSRALTPTSDATYDVGTSVLRYRDGWFSRNGSFAGTLTVTGTTSFNGVAWTWPASAGSSGQLLTTNGSGTFSFTTATVSVDPCDLRLTLTSATPVTTSDVTAATNVYVTPVRGGQCTFYDGSATWTLLTNAEVTVPVPASTVTPYDVWCRNNAGSMACDTTAWTNDTARATALALQNNVYVKTGDTTRRWVGSFRTTGVNGQTEDSITNRFVCNYYNRVRRHLLVTLAATEVYNLTTIRQLNGDATKQVNFLNCLNDFEVEAKTQVTCGNGTAGINVSSGIGLDTTTAFSGETGGVQTQAANTPIQITSDYSAFTGIGKHSLMWNEAVAVAGGNTTCYGSGSAVTNATSFLKAWVWN